MWLVFRKFYKLFSRKQKKQLIILFFLMLFGAFLEVLGVSLIVPLVSVIMQENVIQNNKVVQWICTLLHIRSNKTFLIVCILVLIFVFIFKDLYLMFEIYVQNRFIYNGRFQIQQRLMNTYLDCGYEYYLNASSSEIVRIMQQDVKNAFLLLFNLLNFTTELIVSLVLVIAVFVINPLMSMLVGIVLALTMLVIAKVAKPMLHRQGEILQESSEQTNKWLIQMVNGIKEIMVGNKQEFFRENFNYHGKRLVRAERWNGLLGNVPRLLIEMASIVSMLFALLVAVMSGAEVSKLVPAIAAFAMAALKLMPSANRISSALNLVAYYESSLNNVLENLDLFDDENIKMNSVVKEMKKTFVREKRGNLETSAEIKSMQQTEKKVLGNFYNMTLQHQVELKNISYHYPDTKQMVLQNVDMVIPIGKSIGIVGVSGSGKTTVVDIILGLLNPQSGEVLIDGMLLKENYGQWLSCIGYIPQMIFMLDDTIRANVAFGISPEKVEEEKVLKALEEAQLRDFIEKLPDGLDTRIGERGIRLSGGQRQRIGIARALYPNPELLFFDEATSALDMETETAIMESINRLHGRKTLVIIAHRLATIAECDMVYRVENGRIVREK